MRLGLISMAAIAAAASASAGVTGTTDVGGYTVDLATGTVSPASNMSLRATALAYADWSAPQGAGVLNGVATTGLNRLDGDRINLVPNGVNLLSEMGYSFGNQNPAGSTARVTAIATTISFFDGVTLLPVGSFTSTTNLSALAGGGLAAQASVRLNFAPASLESLGLLLPTNVIVTTTTTSVTFNTGTGTDANLIGQQVRNPVSVGSSADELILNGSVVADPFGAAPAPDGNFSYYIVTNSVPAPGSMALLGLGGLMVSRRRR